MVWTSRESRPYGGDGHLLLLRRFPRDELNVSRGFFRTEAEAKESRCVVRKFLYPKDQIVAKPDATRLQKMFGACISQGDQHKRLVIEQRFASMSWQELVACCGKTW